MAASRWLATIRRGIDLDAPGVAGATSWDVEIGARERAGTPERAYQPTP